MTNQLIISIDSSTTACKAIAWRADGTAVAEGRASYPLISPKPGWHEQDAEEWWTGTCSALQACIAQIPGQIPNAEIVAFGITHQRESFVPVDDAGRPIRNAILWGDERSRQQVTALEERFGSDALHRLTGKPPSMTQSLSKLLWLAENEPAVVQQAARFLDVHAFLVKRLTGAFRTSLACADPMGVVNMAEGRWATDLIQAIGLRPEQFVELVSPGEIIGRITPEAAQATGLPAGLPVVAGAGDGQCAGLGANANGQGRAYLNLGTAVVSGAMSDDYLTERAFRTLYAPLPGTYFLETVLRGGVFTVGWFVEKFAQDLVALAEGGDLIPEQMLETAASKIPPGAQGLMLVPYWNNVMNPYWDPSASGITVGWNGSHGRDHFYRAVLEGIAFEQRLVGEGVMDGMDQPFHEYVVMGGGSRSDLWCQIVADITQVPVARSTTSEATCLGAAVMAASAVNWFGSIRQAADAMTQTAERFEPNPETVPIYDRLYQEVYKPLFPTLQPLLQRLTALSHA